MRHKGTGEMEAETISHLVGRMDAILEIMEFNILQIKMKDYQMKFLIDQVYKANAVNDEIFETYKRDKLNRIKKTYNNGSDEDE